MCSRGFLKVDSHVPSFVLMLCFYSFDLYWSSKGWLSIIFLQFHTAKDIFPTWELPQYNVYSCSCQRLRVFLLSTCLPGSLQLSLSLHVRPGVLLGHVSVNGLHIQYRQGAAGWAKETARWGEKGWRLCDGKKRRTEKSFNEFKLQIPLNPSISHVNTEQNTKLSTEENGRPAARRRLYFPLFGFDAV